MSRHSLKIRREFMEAKIDGEKTFEIRHNDREFQRGDTIVYKRDIAPWREYDGVYKITYVTGFEQKPNWVVFGDLLIDYKDVIVEATPELTIK